MNKTVNNFFWLETNLCQNYFWRALASSVYKFFDKKSESGVNVNEQLPKEFHQLVIIKWIKEKSMRDLKTIFVW